MAKQYWLYKLDLTVQRYIVKNRNYTPKPKDWKFDDAFLSKDRAEIQMEKNIQEGPWKVWKIEEIYDYTEVPKDLL